MSWTWEKPTQPGYYWMRTHYGLDWVPKREGPDLSEDEIVNVIPGPNGGLSVKEYYLEEEYSLEAPEWQEILNAREWDGPIQREIPQH